MSDITGFAKMKPNRYPLHPGAEHPPTMCMEIPIEEYESLKRENAELKAKLESVQATAYADSVDAGMRERKLKRALWIARAERALAERRRYCAMAAFENIENDELRIKWCEIQQKCLKKAEEYK